MADSARRRRAHSTPYLQLLTWQGSPAELIGEVRAGGHAGRALFFDRFGADVHATVRALLGPTPQVDAVARRCLRSAYQAVAAGRAEPVDLELRVRTSVVHVVIRRLGRERWRRRLGRVPAWESVDPELAATYTRLAFLPTLARVAFVLRYVLNYSAVESAALCGCRLSRFEQHLSYAERRLRPCLASELPADLGEAPLGSA